MKALIIAGKYSQDIEVFYPLYRMQEEGWTVDIGVRDNQETVGVYGMPIRPTMDIPEMFSSYFGVILTGGARGLEYLRQDKKLIAALRWYHEQRGVIGSICHGSQLLISAGLCKGRKISGYYSIKDDIVNAGGEFVDAPFVTDDRIISSPHYKYLGPWMKEFIAQVNYHAKQVY